MMKWKNNAAGTLGANIVAGDTSLSLSAGHGARFPATSAEDWFKVTLRDASNNLEIIYVYSRTGDTLDTCVRGQDGTTARAYTTGDAVELRWANADMVGAQEDAVIAPATAGTDTYTANLRITPKAYVTGRLYAAKIGNANTSTAPTINFSALGAKTIKMMDGSAVPAGALAAGMYAVFFYNGTDMLLVNPLQTGFSTGDAKLTWKTVADTGWIMANDGSIGSATSGATTRANADTQALYILLWNNVSDTYAPVATGRGGSGAADFAANKAMTMPKSLGRALAGAGAGAGLTARALGETAGAETATIGLANLPNHVMVNDASGVVTGGATPAYGETTGGNVPLSILDPRVHMNVMVKL